MLPTGVMASPILQVMSTGQRVSKSHSSDMTGLGLGSRQHDSSCLCSEASTELGM